MEPFFPLLVVALIVLVVIGAVFSYLWEKKRREAFRAFADRIGFTYRSGRDYDLPFRHEFLEKLDLGRDRYAMNILEGTWEGFPLWAFDYHYETTSTDSKGNQQTHHHWLSFFILTLSKEFPELLIYPEGFFSKVGQFLGFQDIDFESIEFSRAFVVKSSDKKFAYDVCHTRMMEYLLDHPDLSLEIERDCLSFAFSPRLSPEEVEKRLAQIVEIRKLLPDYLFRD